MELGVASCARGYPLSHFGVPQEARCPGWVVAMSVAVGVPICIGDGCANRFADEAGWEGYCPSCLALWDDHAAGRHDPPEDVCLLCR